MDKSSENLEQLMADLRLDLPLALQIQKLERVRPGEKRGTFMLTCSLARTASGRFWSSWAGREDGPRGNLYLAYSDDRGETWTPALFTLSGKDTPHHFHLTNRVGSLWWHNGTLYLFFIQTIGYFDGRAGTWMTRCENPDESDPDKIRWSEPVRLWHGTPLNKPCIRKNGEWLLPVSLSKRENVRLRTTEPVHLSADIFAELDAVRGANVLVSTDQGKSWQWRSFQRCTDPLFDEHHILERRDGSLRIYARDTFGIVSCDSFDGAYSWTPFKREFYTTSARFFVTALPSGNWLMVRYDTENPDSRKNITAYLSEDEGKSWIGGLLLDDREKISYPDGFIAEDGRIFVQYDHLRQNGSLYMAVFREEDVRAGKNVSGDVILRKKLQIPEDPQTES